jgi:hypothetical protein
MFAKGSTKDLNSEIPTSAIAADVEKVLEFKIDFDFLVEN